MSIQIFSPCIVASRALLVSDSDSSSASAEVAAGAEVDADTDFGILSATIYDRLYVKKIHAYNHSA